MGLQDPDEFERERRNARLQSAMFVHEEFIEQLLQRGTGRSTRTIVAALRDISAGKQVTLIGSNFDMTRRLERDARSYMDVLGLSHRKLKCIPWRQFDYFRTFHRGSEIYLDHLIWEDLSALYTIVIVEG